MKMLLCIAAQTFNLNCTLYVSSGLRGILKEERHFENFECLFRKFNLSHDWFLIFECRSLNF